MLLSVTMARSTVPVKEILLMIELNSGADTGADTGAEGIPINSPELVQKMFRETGMLATGFPSYPPPISKSEL